MRLDKTKKFGYHLAALFFTYNEVFLWNFSTVA